MLSGRNDTVFKLEVERSPNVALVKETPLPKHLVVVEPASRLPSKPSHAVYLDVAKTTAGKLGKNVVIPVRIMICTEDLLADKRPRSKLVPVGFVLRTRCSVTSACLRFREPSATDDALNKVLRYYSHRLRSERGMA